MRTSPSLVLPRIGWWTTLILALGISGYATYVWVAGPDSYVPPLADSFQSRPWGIIPHALFGAIALAMGPFQFHKGIRARRLGLHRIIGRVYVGATMVSAVAGLYMAFFSFGGLVTHLGFGMMAAVTLVATTFALIRIRAGNITSHQQWMLRSYALLFSAVTLRLWLPLLSAAFGSFEPAYLAVSWVSWVPNLLVVEWYIQRAKRQPKLALG